MEEVEKILGDFLPLTAKSLLPEIMKRLEEKGVEEIADLLYLNVAEDFVGILKDVQARKLKEKIDIFFSGSSTSNIEPSQSQVSKQISPEPISQEDKTVTSSITTHWAEEFKLPVNKINSQIMSKLDKGERPIPSQIKEMIRVIVAEAMCYCPKPLAMHMRTIAKKIVSMYPQMKDIIIDTQIGSGYDGLLRKLIARCENVRRPDPKSNRRKLVKLNKKKAYGAIEFCPEFNTNETEESQDLKKRDLQREYMLSPWDLQKVLSLMEETYALQRIDIINASIKDLKNLWPFLFVSEFLSNHFYSLVKVKVFEELENAFKIKIPEIMDFFNKEGLKKDVLDLPEKVIEALCAYFCESTYDFLRLFKEEMNLDEVLQDETMPLTPCIASFGDPYQNKENCIIIIEHVAASEFMNMKRAICVWFASFFVFGLEYPSGCPATLEFMQRAFFGINPENGSKSQKKTKRGVTNCKVINLVQKLCNFKSIWKTTL